MSGMSKIMEKKNAKNGGFELPVWGWMDINLENEVKISTWFAIEGTYQNQPIKGYCYTELIGNWSK